MALAGAALSSSQQGRAVADRRLARRPHAGSGAMANVGRLAGWLGRARCAATPRSERNPTPPTTTTRAKRKTAAVVVDFAGFLGDDTERDRKGAREPETLQKARRPRGRRSAVSIGSGLRIYILSLIRTDSFTGAFVSRRALIPAARARRTLLVIKARAGAGELRAHRCLGKGRRPRYGVASFFLRHLSECCEETCEAEDVHFFCTDDASARSERMN
ncbi:hypothetical protein MTO96_013056 [Rhipicephalus appendiculatus]